MNTARLSQESPFLISEAHLIDTFGHSTARFITRLQYWLVNKKTLGYQKNDRKWIYNTYEEWAKQLRMSVTQTRRIIKKLRDQNILLVEKFAKSRCNHVNYYTLNHEELDKRIQEDNPVSNVVLLHPKAKVYIGQNGRSDVSILDTSLTKKTTKDNNKIIILKDNNNFIINNRSQKKFFEEDLTAKTIEKDRSVEISLALRQEISPFVPEKIKPVEEIPKMPEIYQPPRRSAKETEEGLNWFALIKAAINEPRKPIVQISPKEILNDLKVKPRPEMIMVGEETDTSPPNPSTRPQEVTDEERWRALQAQREKLRDQWEMGETIDPAEEITCKGGNEVTEPKKAPTEHYSWVTGKGWVQHVEKGGDNSIQPSGGGEQDFFSSG